MNINLSQTQLNRFSFMCNEDEIYRIAFNQMMIQMILGNTNERSYCECSKDGIVENAGRYFESDYVAELMIMIFLQLFIDQTLYFVLVESRFNPECLDEPETYTAYEKQFMFIKVKNHYCSGQTSPVNFLDFRNTDSGLYLLNETDLLIEYKQLLWDKTVKDYFLSLGREDIIDLCEKEFHRDLTLRHRYSEEEENRIKVFI